MPVLRPGPLDALSYADLFHAWSRLRAFRGVRWSRVELVVRPRWRGAYLEQSTGVAQQQRIVLRPGRSRADALATLLHEMAHVVTLRAPGHHGPAWREVFARAAAEVAGQEVEPRRRDWFALHCAVARAFGRARVLGRRR